MTKQECVSYLASILTIIDSKEDAAQPRGGILAWEYNRVYNELQGILRKEQEDETRQSEQQRESRRASAANPPRDQPRSGEPNWVQPRQGGQVDIRRKGV